jgi:hypothetical protein
MQGAATQSLAYGWGAIDDCQQPVAQQGRSSFFFFGCGPAHVSHRQQGERAYVEHFRKLFNP